MRCGLELKYLSFSIEVQCLVSTLMPLLGNYASFLLTPYHINLSTKRRDFASKMGFGRHVASLRHVTLLQICLLCNLYAEW